MNEKEIKKQANLKLYPIYKMLSWDLLCFYSISFIFLTQFKGIDAYLVVLLDAFYTVFKIIFQIPCTTLLEKVGAKTSIIVANVAIALYLIILIFSHNFIDLIIANIFCSFGYVIKNIGETGLLYDSLNPTPERGHIFADIEGTGTAYYYFFDAITSSLTGFLYVIHPYLPMILSLLFTLSSIFILSKMHNVSKISGLSHSSLETSHLKDLKTSFKFIFKSGRLKGLLMFYSIFSGFISLMSNYRRSLLQDININVEYFGLIFAVLGIISAISSKHQHWFHNKLRNHTLGFLGITYCLSCIFAGLAVIISFSSSISIILILLMYAIQHIIKGPFYTLSKRYLSNFTNESLRNKIYAATDLVESISKTILTVIASILLEITPTAYAMVILSCVIVLVLLRVLNYMKTRLGLKPEQYSKKETAYSEVQ